jgi:hypothetical protein
VYFRLAYVKGLFVYVAPSCEMGCIHRWIGSCTHTVGIVSWCEFRDDLYTHVR